MAGRIVRDVQIERRAGDGRGREHLRHVLHAGGEPTARFIAQEAPVVLHLGATTRAVDDDRLCAVAERGDVGAREVERFRMEPGMRVQRTAAYLATDLHGLVTIHGQCADRRLVNVGEEALHDATAEKLDGKRR